MIIRITTLAVLLLLLALLASGCLDWSTSLDDGSVEFDAEEDIDGDVDVGILNDTGVDAGHGDGSTTTGDSDKDADGGTEELDGDVISADAGDDTFFNFACQEGYELCGDRCVNSSDDPRHCGTCDRHCAYGEVCVGGVCEPGGDCRETVCVGLSYCDLSTGACTPGCARAEQCPEHEDCSTETHLCSCVEGFHRCDGLCVSDQSPLSCGSRCEPCPTDPNGEASCVEGVCDISCDSGYHLCENSCALDRSVESCGDLCSPCPVDPDGEATCDGNICGIACDEGFRLCGGGCALCPSDPNITGFACLASSCVPSSCAPSYRLCGGGCASCPGESAITEYTCQGTSCIASECHDGDVISGSTCVAGVLCHEDADLDGFGSETVTSYFLSSCPSGWISPPDEVFDCYDDDENVSPDQYSWWSTGFGLAESFDYNCDGIEEMRLDNNGYHYTIVESCEEGDEDGLGCGGNVEDIGFSCGDTGDYIVYCYKGDDCNAYGLTVPCDCHSYAVGNDHYEIECR